MVVLLAGVVLTVVSALVVAPAFLDGFGGPRFAVPGAHTLDLAEGSWTLYERTGQDSDSGVTSDSSRDVSIAPANVSVEGPGPVDVRSEHSGVTETISRGPATYTGAVRLDVETAGVYRITVRGESSGEVLIARPITDLLSKWPWMLAFMVGAVAAIAGLVMWMSGASNRRAARRAGFDPA